MLLTTVTHVIVVSMGYVTHRHGMSHVLPELIFPQGSWMVNLGILSAYETTFVYLRVSNVFKQNVTS